MVTATFRFYEELNDFLPPALRQREFERACAGAATVKHMMEALGVPHTEVELILINGESSGFDQILREGDRVAVYPTFEAFDVTPLLRLRDHPLRVTRFVADVHLGGLAHLLCHLSIPFAAGDPPLRGDVYAARRFFKRAWSRVQRCGTTE